MIDLVLLRELITNDTASGHEGDINSVFAQTGFDCLFGSIRVRASLPYKPIDIVLPFILMEEKTIKRVQDQVPLFANFLSGTRRASIGPYTLTFAPTVVG